MTDSHEVTVNNPTYWVDRAPQLAVLLRGAAEREASGPIGDPTGIAPHPDTIFTVADPMYWASQLAELQDALSDAAGRAPAAGPDSRQAAGAAGTSQERLTLTVEEAAGSPWHQ